MAENSRDKIQTYFLYTLLIIASVLVFLIFKPYIPILLLALVIAVIFQPVYLWILAGVRKKEAFAAALTTALILLIVIIPLAFFGFLVFKEISSSIIQPDKFLGEISGTRFSGALQKIDLDLHAYIKNIFGNFFSQIGSVFSNVATFFVYFILTVFTLFFTFKDGPRIRDALFEDIPFTSEQKSKIIADIGNGIKAVIGGYFLVAIIEGIVSGLGFWIFGLPNPALWGFVTMIAALIPTFGTSLVNIPAIGFLFLTKPLWHGIGLSVWWLAAISIIDNYIGPRFISGRVKIHILLLIFSIIGGLKMFGPTGFFIGPLILIFFWSIMEMFQIKGKS